ncbi:unnamed protein product [Adineta steineri]|uniref:G-protein coupled receptors family 1 profile domain-containing protein n=1 Tax=Adineta steineri TaxID=433720 RepID=A0A815I0Q6_9BILA|nr:unnamed protein product [Adineta steineri]CAF3694017.1 unnamed protein product [Adineta steineri]
MSAYQPDPMDTIYEFCKARNYFGQSSTMIYRWLLTMACIDRYTSSTANARIRRFADPHIASCVVLIIAIIWMILPLHNWIFRIIDGSGCTWSPSLVATYNSALVVIFGFTAPTTVMITCAVLINNNLRHKRNRRQNIVSPIGENQANRLVRARDRQTLVMLYVEIIFYIIFTLPWTIFTVYYVLTVSVTNKTNDQIAIEGFLQFLTETLVYLYPTLSFYLYTLASHTFRQELVKIISAIIITNNQCYDRIRRIVPN